MYYIPPKKTGTRLLVESGILEQLHQLGSVGPTCGPGLMNCLWHTVCPGPKTSWRGIDGPIPV